MLWGGMRFAEAAGTGRREHLLAENVNQVVSRFLKNEDGASAIEYALVASLIAVAIVGSVTAIGTKLSALYADIAAKIP
eukprot:gene11706-11795_t